MCVGLSGGLDSVVLLELLAAHRAEHPLSAVHVHHGLSPHADAWAEACARMCDALGVALAVERVRVDRGASHGLEAAARSARYAVYAARGEPFVALAHHLDDQAETALLQLLRGTGLKGVAAMPEVRALPGAHVSLFRPLLGVPRSALREHARSEGLRWIEDESNASLAHDRNFLRHEIAPRLDARFDGWREAFARFARHAAQAGELLDRLARLDGVADAPGAGLPVDRALEAPRRANALRAFLAVNGIAMPGEARLAEMARQLFGARADARVRIDHGGISSCGIAASCASSAAWMRRAALARAVARRTRARSRRGPRAGAVRGRGGRGNRCLASARASGTSSRARAGSASASMRAGRTRTLKNLLQEAALSRLAARKFAVAFRRHGARVGAGRGHRRRLCLRRPAPGACAPCWRVAGRRALC